MDANRKRRAKRLGTGAPDPDLQAMSDEQLPNPLFGYLVDLPDDALIDEYERAMAALVAELPAMTDVQLRALRARAPAALAAVIETEQERRRPKPHPAPVMEPVAIAAPPIEPHAVVLQEPTPATPRPTPPGAHVSEPVEGCACMLCSMHRRLAHGDDYGPGVHVG
ncbi:MAG: hypothetical protein DMD33_02505 [Gemmatimonadetes bacterium]|nr:MAG: hypothetical protein DMD33_02505 [Gemmatimonadota bacterium]